MTIAEMMFESYLFNLASVGEYNRAVIELAVFHFGGQVIDNSNWHGGDYSFSPSVEYQFGDGSKFEVRYSDCQITG